MSGCDCGQDIDSRLRAVEAAVVELATMGKMMRLLVGIVALSLGVDVTGVVN